MKAVTAITFPYDLAHDLYQEYYRRALRMACQERGIAYSERSNSVSDAALLNLRAIRNSYKLRKLMSTPLVGAAIDSVARVLTRSPLLSPTGPGMYEMATDSGEMVSVCIDARDASSIDEELSTVCRLYFKSNYWPTKTYPSNVVPLPNMNPLVGRNLPYFTALRAAPKSVDLFAFLRIWGGEDEVAGIEHNLELIEGLAKAPCSKYLCAYLVAGDISAIAKRLREQGIAWTTKPMSKNELWQRASQSTLNIVRLGMHECSPWRMIDILAMGGCPVIDYGPQTVWPAPLKEGREYLNLHVEPGTAHSAEISGKLMDWLSNREQISAISDAAKSYFDRHLAPAALGRYILSTIEFI